MSDQFSTEAAKLLLKALDNGHLPFVSIESDSMAPLLRRGDQVQLGSIAEDGLVVGDVIVLGGPEDLLAHRFWGAINVEGQSCLLTRGDRLGYYDPFTPSSQLRAIVIVRRRSGRMLALNQGSGAWLNRRLTQLARLQAQMMQLPLPTATREPGRAVQYGPVSRLEGRGLHLLATVLTALVGRLAEWD